MRITLGQLAPALFEGITIDAATAHDLDDAFRIQLWGVGMRLQVAISRAADWIPAGSALDAAARRLGGTRYYHGRAVDSMLPRALAEDVLSLAPGPPRPIYLVTLDVELVGDRPRVLRMDLAETMMENGARLDYDQAAAWLRGRSGALGAELRLAGQLAERLLEARRAQGALALYFAPTGVWLDEDGRVQQVDHRETAPAHLLVQELMILTNQTLAAAMQALGHPILYRNQSARLSTAEGHGPLLRGAVAALEANDVGNLTELLTLSAHPARYDARPLGHVGLNVPAYGHFTSPIRRYADLVNTRILGAVLRGAPAPYSAETLGQLARALNRQAAVLRAPPGPLPKGAPALAAAANTDLDRCLLAQRGAAALPDALTEELLRRLKEDRLPAKTMALLSLASDLPVPLPLAHGIVQRLRAAPQLAPTLWSIGRQAFGLAPVILQTVGARHQLGRYKVRAQWVRAGRRWQYETAWLPGLRLARHTAQAGLLVAWLGTYDEWL